MPGERVPFLHLVPGVDLGERDRSTIEWLEQADSARWAPSLITTEASPNRGLAEVESFAEEVWELPDQMPGAAFPEFILGFIEDRGVRLVRIADSRLGFDLLPDMASLPRPPLVIAEAAAPRPGEADYARYAARRYGNLVDVFVAAHERAADALVVHGIPPSRIEPPGPSGGVAETARRHAALCERLLVGRSGTSRWRIERGPGEPSAETANTSSPPPLRLPRTPRREASVSVGVPCFQHGPYLDECLRSIKQQFLTPARIVVVDDGSEDVETVEALERWEADPAVTILRQPTNLGPSAVRNRALDLFDTSYGLWIDADDRLMPGALDTMVAKLEAAPEDVGFIYPHAKHMGNRLDCVEMPAYNLWLLLQNNICPSPSLFDLRVFGRTGVRYPEDMVVGHEDWDLILQLAERGVRGLHADGPTFLYRKQGFSRVHAVDYGPHDFHRDIEARHPALYLSRAAIKADWAPALSVVLLDKGGEVWRESDLGTAKEQSCRDFELLAATDLGHGARAVEAAGGGAEKWLQAALRAARGRWVCVLTPQAAATLGRRSFVEQLLRSFQAGEDIAAVAIGSVPGVQRHAFAQMSEEERRAAQLCGVAFERTPGAWIPQIALTEGTPVLADLVLGLQAHGVVQWRLSAPSRQERVTRGGVSSFALERSHLDLNYRRPADRSEIAAARMISLQGPLLPELTPGTVRRWDDLPTWVPPETQPLCRHRQLGGPARVINNDLKPPPGFELEFTLGAAHLSAFPGTKRLVHRAGTFELSESQDELSEGLPLGYLEEERFPTCEPVQLCELPETGDRVLVAGDDDPLWGVARPLASLGWISPPELPPRGRLFHAEPWRAATLHRRVEGGRGRHSYAIDAPSPESVVLGSVLTSPGPDLVELRMRDDGRLVSELAKPGRASRDPRKAARWISNAPPSNDATSYWTPAKRARHIFKGWSGRRLSDDEGTTLGWLRREALPGSRPLFSTTHPVTGDQLVTCKPQEAVGLGYLPDGILGFILESEDAGHRPAHSVPWASA